MNRMKSNHSWLLLVVVQFIFTMSVSGQTFNWVKRVGGLGPDQGGKSCMDLAGNIYVAFAGAGPEVIFNADTASVSGINDLFIVKYDVNGNEVWKLQFGGANNNPFNLSPEGIASLVFDSSTNSLILSGAYFQSCVIDTIALVSPSSNQTTGFIAQLNLNGQCEWARNFGGNGIGTVIPQIDNDDKGSIYTFFGVEFTGILDTIPVTPGGYFGKVNSNGEIQFIKKICRNYIFYNEPVFTQVTLEVANNIVYMHGSSYDSLTLDTILLPNASNFSLVISAWDTSGSIIWAKQTNNSQAGFGTICVDQRDNIYVLDRFAGPFVTLGVDTIFTNGSYGSFLMKFDKTGNLLWHKAYSNGIWGSYGATIDLEGQVYFTGVFWDSLIIDNFSMYSSSTVEELFIAHFDSNGTCIGVRQATGATGVNIIQHNNGQLYLSGMFNSTGNFGTISIPSYGISDIFLANLNAITGLGGGERIIQDQLVIYANPNKGSFRVQVPEQLSDLRGAWLTVYDVQGKEVARFNLDKMNETPQLEINNAHAGFYTVRLVKDKQVFTGKMVVE